MTISATAQRVLIWWAFIFTAIFGFSVIVLMQMAPPPPPSWSAAQTAAWYAQHAGSIRLGAAIAAWTSGFMVPLAVVICAQMIRVEKGIPIWAILELVGGVMMCIFLVLPPDFWGTAAFHTDRLADATALMNDLANLTLVTTDQYYMFQLVPIIVIALTTPDTPDTAFPRWFGYLTIWCFIVYEVGPLGFLFDHGVFAWNGIVVFWLPFVFFGVWISAACWVLLRAIGRQEQAERVAA